MTRFACLEAFYSNKHPRKKRNEVKSANVCGEKIYKKNRQERGKEGDVVQNQSKDSNISSIHTSEGKRERDGSITVGYQND